MNESLQSDTPNKGIFYPLRIWLAWGAYGVGFLFLWTLIPVVLRRLGARPDVLWNFSRWSCHFALWLFQIRVRFRGSPNVPSRHGRLYVANHRSWFDQIVLTATLSERLQFLANAKYFRMPVLGTAMRVYQHIPVYTDRTKALESSQREDIVHRLRNGAAIVVFPEGTRAITEDILPFKYGIFKMAAEAGATVIPIHLLGTAHVLPRKAPLRSIRPGVVDVVVGPSCVLDRKDWKAQAQECEQEFRRHHQSLIERTI